MVNQLPKRNMIDSRALASSAGIVAMVTSAICGAFVAFAPGAVSSLFGWVLHIDLSTMARPISAASYAGGVVVFAAFVWLVVAFVSTLYNRFTEPSPA